MSVMLFCNGIDPDTGDYLVPPMSMRDLASLARRRSSEDPLHGLLRRWWEKVKIAGRDVRDGVDQRNLAEAGWGVIFAAGDKAVPEAYKELGELLSHRKSQAGHLYREYLDGKGYQPGESLDAFLRRNKMDPGELADPGRLPYYLLLVGSPEVIPYSFQQQLDVTYAVGRIYFADPTDYRRYAESVVAAETATEPKSRKAAFFGPSHVGDEGTRLSAEHLVTPLAESLDRRKNGWDVSTFLEDKADKQRLGLLLAGEEAPDFLFTAGHGVGFRYGDPRQITQNGALICHEWPGPGRGPTLPEHYFTADELNGEGGGAGKVVFIFACYSGGTPKDDDFTTTKERSSLVPQPIVAPLAQRLLAHPKGGALAVIGHVDRVWQASFYWPGMDPYPQTFEDALLRLVNGYPVGYVMELFAKRYAALSSQLSALLQADRRGEASDEEVAEKWTAANDVGKYVVVGDPAVRIKPPARPQGDSERKEISAEEARAKGGARLY